MVQLYYTIHKKRELKIVIENNYNDKTSTLLVVEECFEKDLKVKVDAKQLYEREPLGPILPLTGDNVIENGREFIRLVETKVPAKILKPKK